MSDDITIDSMFRDQAEQLYTASNERLDSVLMSLRLDMLDRPAADDALAWLYAKNFMDQRINATFAKDLLTTALYRLARKEAD
jgi:hypothetical protein